AKDLRDRLTEAERNRIDAVNKRHAVTDAITKATLDAEAAETAEQEARALLSRFDAAAKAREAAQRLNEWKTRLDQAEAARGALEESEAQLALLTIPPGAIDELQDLETEIATLRAREEAARPTVAIAYEAGAAGLITMDGTPLA